MSNDDTRRSTEDDKTASHASPSAISPARSIFSVPPTLKRVFDKFPLVTYSENELPLRASGRRDRNVLHVFTTASDTKLGLPSFNPGCLKWQTYLRLSGLSFDTVASNNHASPTGVLPFLLPAVAKQELTKKSEAIPSNKLRKWVASQRPKGEIQETSDVRYEAYASLVDHNIRNAWLYLLYLEPANASLVHRLYIQPCSSNSFVQLATAHQLYRAAEQELVKASVSNTISEENVLVDAVEAVEALSMLLGEDDWFFGVAQPAFLDAAVFAYTHLLLHESLDWQENKLGQELKKHDNLIRHRAQIYEKCYH